MSSPINNESWGALAQDLWRCFVYDSSDKDWGQWGGDLCRFLGPEPSEDSKSVDDLIQTLLSPPEKEGAFEESKIYRFETDAPQDYLIETFKLHGRVVNQVSALEGKNRALARRVALAYLARKMGASIRAGCPHVDQEIIHRLQRHYFEVLHGKKGAPKELHAAIKDATKNVVDEVEKISWGKRKIKGISKDSLRGWGINKSQPIKLQLKRMEEQGPKQFLIALERVANYVQKHLYDEDCLADPEISELAQQEWGEGFADLLKVPPSERPIFARKGAHSTSEGTERTIESADRSGSTEILPEIVGKGVFVDYYLAKCKTSIQFLCDNFFLNNDEHLLPQLRNPSPPVKVPEVPKQQQSEFFLQIINDLITAAEFVASQVLVDLDDLDSHEVGLETLWNPDDPISQEAPVLPRVCAFVRDMENNRQKRLNEVGKEKFAHSRQVAERRWKGVRDYLELQGGWEASWSLDSDPFRNWREIEANYITQLINRFGAENLPKELVGASGRERSHPPKFKCRS